MTCIFLIISSLATFPSSAGLYGDRRESKPDRCIFKPRILLIFWLKASRRVFSSHIRVCW